MGGKQIGTDLSTGSAVEEKRRQGRPNGKEVLWNNNANLKRDPLLKFTHKSSVICNKKKVYSLFLPHFSRNSRSCYLIYTRMKMSMQTMPGGGNTINVWEWDIQVVTVHSSSNAFFANTTHWVLMTIFFLLSFMWNFNSRFEAYVLLTCLIV